MANVASNFGGLIQGVGAAWLMTSISESAAMVALVQASVTLPVMLFSLMSGAVADSFDRRRVMLAAQVFMALVSVSLAACAWLGLITPWLLLMFTFLIGCGVAFNNPAWQASVGDIVPRQELTSAVLLNSASFNVTRSVGPVLGGAIVVAAGAAAAFMVNTISYLGLIIVLWRWKPELVPSALPRERLTAAMTTGIRYVALSPGILRVLMRGFVFGLTTIVILALLPLVARHLVQGNALVYGMLLGAFGVGAVLGALMSNRLRERIANELLVRMTFVAFAVCAITVALSANVLMTSAALILGGVAWVIALSLLNTTVQLSAPRWVVGRALSLYQMAIFGGMALGSWLWGSIAEASSLESALLLAAAGMLLGVLVGYRVPLLSNEVLNLDPLNRWKEPAVALAIEPRNGPIAISIEHRISPAQTDEFLEVMTERRRIRRRDGALDWTLSQDLADPTLWFEHFEVPTWLDYVRFHTRTTQADAPVSDRILSLQIDSAPLRVRRMLEWKGGAVRLGPAEGDVDTLIAS
jgi:MFS family permease